ncbi:MAG: 4Fe-4S ferredoxin [Desulfobulbaceae bacterium A2]|nr:MAG: 4Fe-4S ferredoxin [Desulfobulbaceae bacterium A2]
MVTDGAFVPPWLSEWMAAMDIVLWGAADLQGFVTPLDAQGQGFPRAISLAFPMPPAIMNSLHAGPNQAYADEYSRVNGRINQVATELAAAMTARGCRAQALAASVRSDPVNIKGDFPHKTAATRAGLGWVGRNCQLVTRRFGPWVRLGTVFTDLELPCGPAMEKSLCGRCRRCVDACPAQALQGNAWYPGRPREEILDAPTCDRWKKEQYLQFHNGHVCGICTAACPHGLKLLKSRPT